MGYSLSSIKFLGKQTAGEVPSEIQQWRCLQLRFSIPWGLLMLLSQRLRPHQMSEPVWLLPESLRGFFVAWRAGFNCRVLGFGLWQWWKMKEIERKTIPWLLILPTPLTPRLCNSFISFSQLLEIELFVPWINFTLVFRFSFWVFLCRDSIK